MAQEFAVSYLDSAKVWRVHGFKYMLKPVWSENMGLLLRQEPWGKPGAPGLKPGRQHVQADQSSWNRAHKGQVWLWGQGTTDPCLRDMWAQPQVSVTLRQLRSAVGLNRRHEPTGAKEPENVGHNQHLEQWEKLEHPTT